MRRLVFVTQRIDPADVNLGATVAKIRALAERLDEVVVLALDAVPDALPANCRVHAFGARSKGRRGARLVATLARELAPRPVAVLAHMCPIYAVLAAPLARPLAVPVLLWFNHWKATPTLRLAERAVDAVVTVERRSFPLASPKVVSIGHGIDLSEFPRVAPRAGLHVLALGRYSPAKGLRTIIEAVQDVPEATLEVRGPTLSALERRHRAELEALRAARVQLGGPVPRAQVPSLFARASALVNNMRSGAADKVVYEACASCLPVLASNPVLDDVLDAELRFARDDAGELAARLRRLATLAPDERARLGAELRARVASRHSVESWADGVLRAARP